MDEAMKRLLEVDRDFAKLSKEKGAEVAFAFYLTDNSIQLPNGHPADKGKVMKAEPGETLEWEPSGGGVSVSQDLGYTWGEYVFTLANGNQVKGKYLNIWRKQSDGSWKVEVDMGNSSS